MMDLLSFGMRRRIVSWWMSLGVIRVVIMTVQGVREGDQR
jgi:hypothetical protein